MTSNNMMTSLAQNNNYPVGMQQHPSMQGHPMGLPHNPGQPGQPGPGMPQQMHMGVSGPGPQVSQGGAMMGAMPPGAGGPSAHALQHLNPGQQQQMFQQQQQMAFASNPQLQAQMAQQQQQMIAHQRHQQAARQAMLAQQYSGVPIGMQNGMNQMTQAQFNAMRGGPMARPVNLPQHLQAQQAQAQAEHSLQQQQAAQQQHHQAQLMMAQQQMAMQQQAAQQQNNPNQPNQMSQQQAMQQAQQQAQHAQAQQAMQAHQQAQAQAQAQVSQTNQAQSQSQTQAPTPAPAQQSIPNSQSQTTQAQQTPQGIPQQQVAAMIQQRQGDILRKGQCLMKLVQFGDHLSNFGVSSKPLSSYMANGAQRPAAQGSKQKDDLTYWLNFVDKFFSPKGVLRHSVFVVDENSNKQYEITFPALPRYFHTHFESGIRNMQMIMERGLERELPNNGHYIESQKSSFVYWFDNGSQLVANGSLKAHFDADQKIELLEFVTSSHDEYVPRSQVLNAARPWHEWQKEWTNMNSPGDGKQSPEMNKKKPKPMKSPNHPPPDLELPDTKVKSNMGITPSVFQFLEFAEVIVQMNPLFGFSHQNPSLTPYAALETYVTTIATGNANGQGPQQQNPSGPRTPGIGNFPIGTSPAQAHLNLPGGANSPHMGSPAQGTGMQHQQSQHGTSSSGPSANTSPNASNKRRRPSGVKEEDTQINGAQKTGAIKPSPRIGGKRQKPNQA